MKIKVGYYLNYLFAVFGFNQPQNSCETRKYCIEFVDPCPCSLFSHEHLTVAGFNRNVNQNRKHTNAEDTIWVLLWLRWNANKKTCTMC